MFQVKESITPISNEVHGFGASEYALIYQCLSFFLYLFSCNLNHPFAEKHLNVFELLPQLGVHMGDWIIEQVVPEQVSIIP